MKHFTLVDYFASQGLFLTQAYGVNSEYYSQFNLLFHEGDDFGHNNKKIIVKSPLNGIVIFDDDDGRGNYGVNTKIWDDVQMCAVQFCHFDANYVTHGQRVKIGDNLGEMGATGNSDGEHIHFNFMLTDANGNRLYNAYGQNWGFLDPQHPMDPNEIVKLPGVEDYIVEWVKPGTTTPLPVPQQPMNDNNAKLAHYFNLMWHATFGDDVDTNKVTESEVFARIAEMKSEKIRGGRWDQLAKLAGYTGDTSKLTAQELFDLVDTKLQAELKACLAGSGPECELRIIEERKKCKEDARQAIIKFANQM